MNLYALTLPTWPGFIFNWIVILGFDKAVKKLIVLPGTKDFGNHRKYLIKSLASTLYLALVGRVQQMCLGMRLQIGYDLLMVPFF